jgi:hypothetical protein
MNSDQDDQAKPSTHKYGSMEGMTTNTCTKESEILKAEAEKEPLKEGSKRLKQQIDEALNTPLTSQMLNAWLKSHNIILSNNQADEPEMDESDTTSDCTSNKEIEMFVLFNLIIIAILLSNSL